MVVVCHITRADAIADTIAATPPHKKSSIRCLWFIGKGGAKKGDAAVGDKAGGDGGGGAAAARRANVAELKGLVEVRASSQAARAGAAAVTGEGRPLLQVRARIGIKVRETGWLAMQRRLQRG